MALVNFHADWRPCILQKMIFLDILYIFTCLRQFLTYRAATKRSKAFTCLRQFLTYRAATITLATISLLSQKLSQVVPEILL